MDIGPYNKDPERYNRLIAELYANHPKIELPPEYAYFIQNNLLQFLIRLARYKFVTRMIKLEDEILEIGCGSGLGAIFLGQHCKSVKGIDVKEHEIKEARSINRRANVHFEVGDFFELAQDKRYDVVLAMDVIEHMPEETGHRLVSKAAQYLKPNGMLAVGTPSCYAHPYESEFSRASHIKMYDQKELVSLMEEYFGRVIAFSMNDEMVHTGFSKLAWYYLILAFVPKTNSVDS